MQSKFLVLSVLVFCCGCSTTYHNALCERPEYYAKWEDKCREYSDTKINKYGYLALGAALAAAGSYQPPEPAQMTSTGTILPTSPGHGIDQFGRAVTLQGGVSNSYIKTPNAYGPGMHMDQYGNKVMWK